MCPWAIYIKRKKERFEWWKIYVAIVCRLSCNTGEKKIYFIYRLHFIFNNNPVCVCVCFCSVWYVCEWKRTMFQHGWFVDADTHISMLKKENLFLFIVYTWLIFIFYFLSTNNQGFLKPHVLSRMLDDLFVVESSACESHPVLFSTKEKCYVMCVFAI
jgi:hypothetical protein